MYLGDYDYNGFGMTDCLFLTDRGIRIPVMLRCRISARQCPTRNSIFGIMGNQLLSKAGGAKIYKLKYGHRSHNQPVRMVGTERCFITSQNHGYAVDNITLSADWEPLFINMNDGSTKESSIKETLGFLHNSIRKREWTYGYGIPVRRICKTIITHIHHGL